MIFRRLVASLLAAALILANSAASAAEGPLKPAALGAKVLNSNSLRDLRGGKRPLDGFAGNKAVVLVFLGADCPVSNLYLPGLVELEKKYRGQKVQFVAVYPNEPEDFDKVAGHAADRDVPFLVVKDFGQKLADAVGVTRVPGVVVLDGELAMRYRGRVDDQYTAGTKKQKPTRADLAEAIDEVVAGKKVAVAETEADGCLIARIVKRSDKKDVTFSKDVALILQKRCQNCHRPDQNAPFALMTYDDAARHADMLKEVTTQRRMPPWHADSRYGKFSDDRRMTKDEIDTLVAWVDAGKPKGDEKDLPKPVEWPTGWSHGKPDLVLSMPEEFEVPAAGVLPYKNWIIETNFDEDKWVTAAEARPGNAAVVHHIVAYIQAPGQRGPIGADGALKILVGWAPGDLGMVLPPDTAMRVPKGAKLRLEMHYTPTGRVVKDRSSIGLTFAKKPPKYELLIGEFANMSFEVPPGSPHHRAEASFRLRADARIVSFAPHMHWRGKDYSYEVIYPDGKKETLLSVPRWDFNWQNVYRFQEPLKLPKGAKLHSVAHWDNSPNNPLNPDPSKGVRFGLQTWDEMMVGFVAYVWERPETAAELAKNPPSQADLIFDRLDLNGDDFITSDEIPERMKPFIAAAGFPVPDKISRDEFKKLFETFSKAFRPKKDREKKD
jgi:thiol-disulfide isomerase/thioredoxin